MSGGCSKGFWVAHHQKITRETTQGACKLLISGQPGLSSSLAEILAEPQLGTCSRFLAFLTPKCWGESTTPVYAVPREVPLSGGPNPSCDLSICATIETALLATQEIDAQR
jgi:hypothetical protein